MYIKSQSNCHVTFENFTQLGQTLLHFSCSFVSLVSITSLNTKESWQFVFDQDDRTTELKNTHTHVRSKGKKRGTVFSKYTRLSDKGYVKIEGSSSFPLRARYKHSVATCKIVFDFTPYTKLYDLFVYYHHYYPEKDQAIQKISEYWNLANFFKTPLKSVEFLTLLVLIQEQYHKPDASFMHTVPYLISNYLPVVRAKLKPNIHLHELLLNLTRHRKHCD